jgi:hypothetical protein
MSTVLYVNEGREKTEILGSVDAIFVQLLRNWGRRSSSMYKVGAQKTIVVSKKVCETYIRTYELTNPLQCKLFPLVHATAWTLGFSTLQYTLLLSTTACLITSLLKNN